MMYGIWNKKSGRDKQVLRYYSSPEEADARAQEYLNSTLGDPYRDAYWEEGSSRDNYEIVEFPNVYPLTPIINGHSEGIWFVLVDELEFRKVLQENGNSLSKIKLTDIPFLNDLHCCYRETEDAIDDMDTGLVFIEYHGTIPVRVFGQGVGEIARL